MSDSQATAKMDRTSAPQSDQDTRPLAETGNSGIERLRELEKLLGTARKVRKLAESDIAQGRNLDLAQQRFDAANRMQRKVERELLKLRSELANDHPEVNQVWTPGDPVGRKPTPRKPQPPAEASAAPQPGDFELSVMLGKDKARWNQPGTTQFDLDQGQSVNLPPSARKPAPKPRPAPRHAAAALRTTEPTRQESRGTNRARQTAASRPEGRRKAWLVWALIAAGVFTGAGLAVTFSGQGDNEQSYWDQARTWFEGFSDSPDPAASARPVPVSTSTPRERTATPPTDTTSGSIRRTRPTTGQIMNEERRLQREAQARYESRLKQLRNPEAGNKSASLF